MPVYFNIIDAVSLGVFAFPSLRDAGWQYAPTTDKKGVM